MKYKTLSIETDGTTHKTIVRVNGEAVGGLTSLRLNANLKKCRVVVVGKMIDSEATKEQQKIVRVPVEFVPEA